MPDEDRDPKAAEDLFSNNDGLFLMMLAAGVITGIISRGLGGAFLGLFCGSVIGLLWLTFRS